MRTFISVPRQEYPAFLERRLEELAWRGESGFTLSRLSEFSKLPITPNMRRRISQLVESGQLERNDNGNYQRGTTVYYSFVSSFWPEGSKG